MIRKLKLEVRVIRSVVKQVIKCMIRNRSIKRGLEVTFGKEARYQINEGPWIQGNVYRFFKELYNPKGV